MRYWLRYRKGNYYIISRENKGIIYEAVIQGTRTIASIESNSQVQAFRHLYTIALFHHLSNCHKNMTEL